MRVGWLASAAEGGRADQLRSCRRMKATEYTSQDLLRGADAGSARPVPVHRRFLDPPARDNYSQQSAARPHNRRQTQSKDPLE